MKGLLDGQGGIRTHDTLAGTPVFKTGSFNHSDTCPDDTTYATTPVPGEFRTALGESGSAVCDGPAD